MRIPGLISCCLFALVPALVAADPPVATYAPMIETVAPAVVTVFTSAQTPAHRLDPEDPVLRFFGEQHGRRRLQPMPPGQPRQLGQGSGVIVDASGTIVTNNHVIEGADTIEVQLRGSSERITAKLVGADPKTDVAVLRIDGKDRHLQTATFTDSDAVRVGDLAFAIGNPFGVGNSVSMGIVSATGRGDVGITDYEDFIQTDASINPGNSGGALVDSLGHLVGLNTAIFSRNGGNIGIGFAVPANLVKRVLEQITAGGKVVRGYLGVQISPLDAPLARKFGLDGTHGALVNEVLAGGPAAKAGIQAGDVITKIGTTQISDPRQLRMLVAGLKPGNDITVAVKRDGKDQDLTLNLGELPNDPLAAREQNLEDTETGSGKLGVALMDLDAATRHDKDIPARIQGALVTEVVAGSRAERAGLQPDMVITEVERRAVADTSATVQQLRLAKGELLLRVWAKGGLRWVVVPE